MPLARQTGELEAQFALRDAAMRGAVVGLGFDRPCPAKSGQRRAMIAALFFGAL
ncbi:MAG: hypothetical protein ACR2GP_12400 [Burkholderiaceae bacterium]